MGFASAQPILRSLDDTGAVISATPFPAGAYRERTGFMHELREDGLDL
jgi:hypothetical protein